MGALFCYVELTMYCSLPLRKPNGRGEVRPAATRLSLAGTQPDADTGAPAGRADADDRRAALLVRRDAQRGRGADGAACEHAGQGRCSLFGVLV